MNVQPRYSRSLYCSREGCILTFFFFLFPLSFHTSNNTLQGNTSDISRTLCAVMGVGALLAAFLSPSQIVDQDAAAILRREVERYSGNLMNELRGVNLMSAEDRAALGPAYAQRTDAADETLKNVNNFYQLFLKENAGRNVVEVDRVTLGNDPSMGYCNMHDLLIQFVRDWGSENDNVRETHHDIILSSVKTAVSHLHDAMANGQYTPQRGNGEGLRVLTPGDALCRLSYDLASSGDFTEVEANEGSPLFAEFGIFMLNRVSSPFAINPHAGVWYNQDSLSALFRSVTVPTPFPSEENIKSDSFKLTVGAFESLYKTGGSRHKLFDVVVTSFFLDTIPGSITRALTTLSELLGVGAYWVNYGPLLYRGDEYPKLTWEEIILLLPSRGFEVVKNEHVIHAQYCEKTEGSLHPTVYNPRLLIARKVR